MTGASTIAMCIFLLLTSHWLYLFFTTDPEVIRIGLEMLYFLVPTYITYISIEILSGAIRGTGDSFIPMVMTLGGICLLRVVWLFFVVPLQPRINTVLMSYPVTWTVTSTMFFVYYKFGRWRKGLE